MAKKEIQKSRGLATTDNLYKRMSNQSKKEFSGSLNSWMIKVFEVYLRSKGG